MNHSFKIYNASAGSGKTHTLTKEYLKIILKNQKSYQKILAITFTNKAVAEMKTRILTSLFEFSKEEIHDKYQALFTSLLEELEIDKKELQKKAKNTLKDILHNYAFFDISTIDKFTHRLIRTFAKDLKIPQNFDVILDTNLLIEEAVSKLINKAGSDEKLTKVLIDFALDKADGNKSWDVSYDLIKTSALLFKENNLDPLNKLKDKNIASFVNVQLSLKEKIKTLEEDISENANTILKLIRDNSLSFSDFNRGSFPKLIDKIAQGIIKIDSSLKWIQNFNTNPLYAKSCDEDIKSILNGLHIEFSNLFNQIQEKANQLKMLRNIFKNIVPLTVLNALRQEIKTIEATKNQLHISNFNTLISEQIKDQPAPFIYERLGEKYNHFFIDEFQDTSELQWRNLIPLIDNALASTNGSLFLVGDAKQAIYRWRGGKAEQFLNLISLYENPFVVPPKVESLPVNYRSHKEIVEFNNAFFTSTLNVFQNTAYRNLFEEGNQQKVKIDNDGLVQLHFLETNDQKTLNEQYCDEVLNTINEIMHQNYEYSDICILVRRNADGVLLADFLSQNDIPIISSESLLLNNHPKVRFLINLLHLIETPNDDELAYNILSFLATDNTKRHEFISNHLKSCLSYLDSEFNFDLTKLKTKSVYDLIEDAIKQFDFVPFSDAHINYFMDVIIEVEENEGESITTFLDYWEKKKDKLSVSSPNGINAVQIMTVHKSKGLEFNLVIYPFANSRIHQEIEPKLWLPVDANEFNGFEQMLISKNSEVVSYSEKAEEIFNAEHHKLELDFFNVLYVALTRAVKGLYVITKKDLTKSGAYKMNVTSGLFIDFLKQKELWQDHQNQYTFGKIPVKISNEVIEEPQVVQYQYSYKNRPNLNILTRSGFSWSTDSDKALSKGNLMHYIMSHIKTAADIDSAIFLGTNTDNYTQEEYDYIHSITHKIVQHPSLNQYFQSDFDILNEKDIMTDKGAILRPDRVVIKNNSATIIDYKTGKKNSKFTEQLYSYADALEMMGYAIENKIIVYINEDIQLEFI